MKFSVILPVYNVAAYLPACVDSVLQQTYTDYEILLVDDGSTDGSAALCDELAAAHERVRVIHKPNGGLSDARNAGTAEAKGEYIVYIDSDDYVLSNDFLETLAAETAESPDLIFYKYQKYFDATNTLEPCRFSYAAAQRETDYAQQLEALVKADAFYGMAWIKAIRRSLITENGIAFQVGLLGEDMDWNYQVLFRAHSLRLIDRSFLAYRQREGSITATHKLKNLTDFLDILETWSARIDACDDPILKRALYGSLAKYYANLLVVYERLGDPAKAGQAKRVKALSYLLRYGMSDRPRKIALLYRVLGFRGTVFALRCAERKNG